MSVKSQSVCFLLLLSVIKAFGLHCDVQDVSIKDCLGHLRPVECIIIVDTTITALDTRRLVLFLCTRMNYEVDEFTE